MNILSNVIFPSVQYFENYHSKTIIAFCLNKSLRLQIHTYFKNSLIKKFPFLHNIPEMRTWIELYYIFSRTKVPYFILETIDFDCGKKSKFVSIDYLLNNFTISKKRESFYQIENSVNSNQKGFIPFNFRNFNVVLENILHLKQSDSEILEFYFNCPDEQMKQQFETYFKFEFSKIPNENDMKIAQDKFKILIKDFKGILKSLEIYTFCQKIINSGNSVLSIDLSEQYQKTKDVVENENFWRYSDYTIKVYNGINSLISSKNRFEILNVLRFFVISGDLKISY